jgi:hypothetical protein
MKKEIILKSAEIYNRYADQLLTLYRMKNLLEQCK